MRQETHAEKDRRFSLERIKRWWRNGEQVSRRDYERLQSESPGFIKAWDAFMQGERILK